MDILKKAKGIIPWKEREETPSKKLEKEVARLLVVMENAEPASQEYKIALEKYEILHKHQLHELSLKESRKSRVAEILVTCGLFVATTTAEYWAPITSKWGNTLTRPFRVRKEYTFGERPFDLDN